MSDKRDALTACFARQQGDALSDVELAALGYRVFGPEHYLRVIRGEMLSVADHGRDDVSVETP